MTWRSLRLVFALRSLVVGVATLVAAPGMSQFTLKTEPSAVCEDGSGPLIPVLDLAWNVGLGDVGRRYDGGAKLRVENLHSHDVVGTFEARLNAGASSAVVGPVKLVLRPGEARSFEVDPSLEPWDWEEIRSSGTIRAQVIVRGGKRTLRQVLRAEPLFFHREGAEMLFYSADVLARDYGGGDLGASGASNTLFYQHQGRGLPFDYEPLTGSGKDDWSLAPLPDAFIPYGETTPTDPGAGAPGGWADHRQVCLWLDTDFEDGDVGDYLTGDWQHALGARYHLGIPWVGTYTGYASRGTGCLSLPVNAPELYVTIFFESKVGYGNRNLLLRSFGDFEVNGDVPWSFENWEAGGSTDEDVPRNSIHVEPAPGLDTIHLATHPANVTLANLLAVASRGVMRLEEATLPPASPFSVLRKMELIPRDCPNAPVGTSCAGNGPNYWELSISPAGSDTHRKFLIGHEVGHWYHYFQVGGYPPFDYSEHASPTVCNSENIVGDHAMRSKEHEAGALTEGFAHFLSAYMLNAASGSDGWFQYYKQHAEYGYDYDLIDLLGETGGPSDVLHNVCGCDDGSCTDGYGVELDWLRHYWRFYRDPGATPTMAEIFQQLKDTKWTLQTNNVFFPLRDALSGALQTKWEELGEELGANSTPW